jgi:hypothetical protein
LSADQQPAELEIHGRGHTIDLSSPSQVVDTAIYRQDVSAKRLNQGGEAISISSRPLGRLAPADHDLPADAP